MIELTSEKCERSGGSDRNSGCKSSRIEEDVTGKKNSQFQQEINIDITGIDIKQKVCKKLSIKNNKREEAIYTIYPSQTKVLNGKKCQQDIGKKGNKNYENNVIKKSYVKFHIKLKLGLINAVFF